MTATSPYQFDLFWRGHRFTLWCQCGKSIDVSDGRPLARERDRHRCGPAGSPWDQPR